MSKKRPDFGGRAVQLTLPLSSLPTANRTAGSLRVKEAVQEALSEAIRRSGLSREYIAQELSRLTGDDFSVHALNNWTAESKDDRRMPLEAAGAMAVILQDKSILEAALGSSGHLVLSPKERPIFELGRITVEKKRRSKKERDLWEQLDG